MLIRLSGAGACAIAVRADNAQNIKTIIFFNIWFFREFETKEMSAEARIHAHGAQKAWCPPEHTKNYRCQQRLGLLDPSLDLDGKADIQQRSLDRAQRNPG